MAAAPDEKTLSPRVCSDEAAWGRRPLKIQATSALVEDTRAAHSAIDESSGKLQSEIEEAR